MFDDGLKPERTWLVDIPYSTSELVRAEIYDRFAIPKHQISPPMRDPLIPYALMQLRRVQDVVYHLSQSTPRSRLLVVDDGAYFVRAIADLEILDPEIVDAFCGRTVIVEQTTRGHRYLQESRYRRLVEDRLEAPVVSIARCRTKTEFEGPFIGAAARHALTTRFERERIDLCDLDRIAVVGFGVVGQAVFHALQKSVRGKRIVVVDTDKGKHQQILDKGGEPHSALPRHDAFDLVVGCTGHAAFGMSDWETLANIAYLVSSSSAAVEFNRKKFIDLADLYPDDQIEIVNREETRKQGIHATVTIRDEERDRQISFVNASFPVNFDGRLECLPANVIQATHTLLYAASCQALAEDRPGLATIDGNTDSQILDMALKHI
jgi:hypothetical protein